MKLCSQCRGYGRLTTGVWWTAVLAVHLIVAAAHGQKTTVVEVFLEPCVKPPSKVWFVLNGTELEEMDHTKRQWLFSLPKGKEFVIQDACASLRLGGARTDCRRPVAIPDPGPPYGSTAQFTFQCDEREAWPVIVGTEPDTIVRYVRRIPNTERAMDSSQCQCLEESTFTGRRTLLDVRFPGEKLSLHLGVTSAKDKNAGLSINAIKLTKAPKPFFTSAVTFVSEQTGPRTEGDHESEEYQFSSGKVAGLLAIQRAKADGSAPTLSSTAIDLDMVKLKDLTKLTLRVN